MSASSQTQFIEHVVLFKIKPDVDPATVAVMVDNLQRLRSIDTARHLGAGPLVRFRSSCSLDYTHIIHIRFASKADLDAFAAHPTHLDVVKYNKPNIEDVMALDWVHSADSFTIPSGSAMRVTFLKLKENVEEDKHKNELIGAIRRMKDKFPAIELLSCGENFVPGRDKGFSIASIAVFKGIEELEGFHSEWEAAANEQKDLVKEKADDSLVLDFVIP